VHPEYASNPVVSVPFSAFSLQDFRLIMMSTIMFFFLLDLAADACTNHM
jgi:hypothetical protein